MFRHQQQNFTATYYDDVIVESEDRFAFDHGSNEFMHKRPEIKHTTRVAKTKRLSSTRTSKDTNNKEDVETIENSTVTAINNRRKTSVRKNSIARLSHAFRDLQHTITPRKAKHRKTTDCNFNDQTSPGFNTKKSVERSASLPNIKENSKKNVKRKSMFRKLSRSNSNANIKRSPDFESTEIITFPSNRLEAYRTKSTDSILQSEIVKINRRRQQGRSTSAQFTNNRETPRDLKVTRERSFSTDCDEHLFSFDLLVARRLNSSKETQLCETDL